MRCLHVVPALAPEAGGPTTAAIALVQALRNRGLEAEIATTEAPPALPIPVFSFPVSRWTLRQYAFAPALATWLQENIPRYDLVHLHGCFAHSSTVAAAIARRHRIPYLWRTLDHLSGPSLAKGRWYKHLYLRTVDAANLRSAVFHCTSEPEAQWVKGWAGDRPVLTIPLGVDPIPAAPDACHTLRQRWGLPIDTPIVLFLSRLHPKKQPEILLQALAGLDRPWVALMAGTGDPAYLKRLVSLSQNRGLGDRVKFLGFVQGEAKTEVLRGSDVFALPSQSENFGLAVAEAMAAGLPVLVTPGVQIAPEIERAGAGLVIPPTVEAWRVALETLLADPHQRQSLGQNGQMLVQQTYQWGAIADRLVTVYRQLLSPS
ncbi:MAG TPA: group 1 glycosyl transferase [Cyanobacteria bacterium UBA8156]|jgi:glycosyltransferase involved in cell wall biosynthesis|nr:group 1 glycosyl transferase [Cyanobacteria bacterium UBA8156]